MAQKKTIVIEAKDNTKQAFNKVQKNLKATDQAVNKTKRSMDGLKSGIKGAIGALTVGAFVGATKSTLDLADALGKTSARLGLTTTKLQTLRFAATQSGMSTEMLEMSMQRFTRRMAEADKGTGVLKDTFKELGIEIRDPNGQLKNAESILGDVADKMASIPEQGKRVELAFKMFDSEGVKMVNMLQGGSKAFGDLRQSLIDTGAIMTDSFIKNAETANDALDKLSQSMRAGFASAISGLAPVITDVADSMTDFIALCRQFPIVTAMAGAISAIGISLALLGGPITIALAGITALIGGASWLNQKFKDQKDDAEKASDAVKKLGESHKKVTETVKGVAKETFDMNSENRRQQLQISKWMVEDTKEKASKVLEIEQMMYTKKLDYARDLARKLRELQLKETQDVLVSLGNKKQALFAWMDERKQLEDSGMASIESNYKRQKELLDVAYLGELENKKLHTAQMLKVDKAYEKAKYDLQIERAGQIASLASGLSEQLYSEGLMGFEAMKAFAYVEALINAQVAATKALAQLGPIAGPVAAGLIYASAMMRANQISHMSPPKREAGGPVSRGKSFLVGERGPELFTPNQSGNISSNANSGGSANVTFNIQANDTRGFDQLLQQRRGMIVGMINRAMRAQARGGLI